MVFSSSIFLFLFLPLTLAGYFLIRTKFRNAFLLAASLCFYAWGETFYVMIMLWSIGINYLCGLLTYRQLRQEKKRISPILVLWVGVACNLCLLFYFKYVNFFFENINLFLEKTAWPHITFSPVHLPLGISFFTFQAMSYLIDIYRKDTGIQRNIINCALYISFFPQLIAGPIVRYHDIAKQIISRTVTIQLFSSGIRRFIFGLSKKLLLANQCHKVKD